MPSFHRSTLAFAVGLLLSPLASADVLGDWRVVRSRPAPWLAPHLAPPAAALRIGAPVRLSEHGIDAPAPLACGQATLSTHRIPAEGLFQGGLDRPAAQAAELGFGRGPHDSLRIDCDSGSWDFHAIGDDVLLFALDQRIYTLGRSPGTRAQPGSPAAQVQALLEAHYAGGTRFDPERTEALRDYLSEALRRDIAHYFAAPWPADEVPPINGDPYTGSQEIPTHFRVLDAQLEGERARVPVEFADAYRQKRVDYLLQQIDGRWLLRDLEWSDGHRFVDLLTERPG